MPWFVIQVEGRFRTPVPLEGADGNDRIRGFVTSRAARGATYADALPKILDSICDELRSTGLPYAEGDVLFKEHEAWQHRWWRPGFWRMRGFTFFTAIEPDDEW